MILRCHYIDSLTRDFYNRLTLIIQHSKSVQLSSHRLLSSLSLFVTLCRKRPAPQNGCGWLVGRKSWFKLCEWERGSYEPAWSGLSETSEVYGCDKWSPGAVSSDSMWMSTVLYKNRDRISFYPCDLKLFFMKYEIWCWGLMGDRP